MSASRAVPLTVIGGFLGAGKTTLLNALLAQAEGRRIAVLINDFGDLQIDAALIAHRNATTVSLRNGCVCCSLAGGLMNALSEALTLDPLPNNVVVEASGVSDPRRIAQVARTGAGFSPDATVVVVAADHIEALAHDRYVADTVMAQLASADLLICNKIDLVDQTHKQRVLGWLRGHAPRATLVEAQHAKVPIEITLGPLQPEPQLHQAQSGSNDIRHSDQFATRVFRCAGSIGETRLHQALAELPPSVIRLKGFVRLDSSPQRLRLVQGVGRRCTISEASFTVEQEGSALVVIGVKEVLRDEDLTPMRELFNQSLR